MNPVRSQDVVGIRTHLLCESVSHWILDDVFRNLGKIFIFPQNMIPERSLPKTAAVSLVPGHGCGIGLEPPDRGDHLLGVGYQPVKMIRHHTSGDGLGVFRHQLEDQIPQLRLPEKGLSPEGGDVDVNRGARRVGACGQAVAAAPRAGCERTGSLASIPWNRPKS